MTTDAPTADELEEWERRCSSPINPWGGKNAHALLRTLRWAKAQQAELLATQDAVQHYATREARAIERAERAEARVRELEALLREAHEARVVRESGSYGDLCERIERALEDRDA